MRFIDVPENMPLEWYLGHEEQLAQHVEEPTMFFWRVDPTVIIGRHQVLENEVNVAYCEHNGIRVVRRKSGGGCVYADRGNLMLSYISPSAHSEQVFADFLQMVSGALSKLGFPATTTSHNDILVAGRKVCGCACYALPTATIVHSTMLCNEDFDAMAQAITPPLEKLQRHGVASVRQRVVNLAELGDISNMEEKLKHTIAQSTAPAIEKAATIIFDLDGTLLNTIDDLGMACNHALAANGYPTHPIERYPKMVGNGINKLILRALPEEHRDEECLQRMRELFIPYYNAHNCVYTRPYEGIIEVLQYCKAAGHKLAMASNKYDEAAKAIVEHYFPGLFDMVLGERAGVERKPNPQIVHDILTALHSGTSTVLYVGDSTVDIDTARNAGIPCIACTWGYETKENIQAAQPSYMVDTPQQLMEILKKTI